MCQISQYTENEYVCARLHEASFLTTDGNLTYVMVGGNEGRTSYIELQCTPSAEGTIEVIGEKEELKYVFTI